MNHVLATPQYHRLYQLLHSMYLTLLPLLCRMVITNHTLHQWCIVLINTNQILFQEVTIKFLDHNIMKEITMLTAEIQGIPQETIRILILQIHKVHFPVKVTTTLVAAAKTSNHIEVLPSGLLRVTLVGNTVNIRPIIILY
jgi:phenylpyruvate tautomerase PptA (4-oxalocrotonate tautomerase family)